MVVILLVGALGKSSAVMTERYTIEPAKRFVVVPVRIKPAPAETFAWPDANRAFPLPYTPCVRDVTSGHTVMPGGERTPNTSHTDQRQDVVRRKDERGTLAVKQEEIVTSKSTLPTAGSQTDNKFIKQAKEDLAKRLKVDINQIELLEFKAVLWPDGGMGCPRPGMVYIQVQQEGYRIRLRVGDRLFAYHGGGNRPPFLCEKTAK